MSASSPGSQSAQGRCSGSPVTKSYQPRDPRAASALLNLPEVECQDSGRSRRTPPLGEVKGQKESRLSASRCGNQLSQNAICSLIRC